MPGVVVHSHANYNQCRGQWRMELIICHFSLSSLRLSVWLIFFPSDHAGRVPQTQFRCCLARLVGRKPCPLNSQPPRILHRPSNPGRPAPSGRGSWGPTQKSEWLFQASVAVETGCTGLGGPLHHPPVTQPMGSELHPGLRTPSQAPPPTAARTAHQWTGPLP